jgi:hypothetical protein
MCEVRTKYYAGFRMLEAACESFFSTISALVTLMEINSAIRSLDRSS